MKVYDKNGNENYLSEIISIDCNIELNQKIVSDSLKGMKFVICNFLSSEGNWCIPLICFANKYSVNTFSDENISYIVGATYDSTNGKVTHSYCRNPNNFNFTITKIIGIK